MLDMNAFLHSPVQNVAFGANGTSTAEKDVKPLTAADQKAKTTTTETETSGATGKCRLNMHVHTHSLIHTHAHTPSHMHLHTPHILLILPAPTPSLRTPAVDTPDDATAAHLSNLVGTHFASQKVLSMVTWIDMFSLSLSLSIYIYILTDSCACCFDW